MTSDGALKNALRAARVAEAAHFEAVLGIWDAKSLRLHALREDLMPLLVQAENARELFDLALVAGEAPRLWIDLISFVEMEPDYRTYCFFIDNEKQRNAQFETASRSNMVAHLTQYLAHKLVVAEKSKTRVEIEPIAKSVVAVEEKAKGLHQFSLGAVVYAWISGFALGGLILTIVFILLKRLTF